jgi:hypothetical protein
MREGENSPNVKAFSLGNNGSRSRKRAALVADSAHVLRSRYVVVAREKLVVTGV